MQLASSKDDNDFNVQVKYIILGQKQQQQFEYMLQTLLEVDLR